MGLVPARGRWENELFDVLSTATFRQGALVKLNGARTVSEYSGGEASFLGIALHNSSASLPAGKVLIAIPTSQDCTAIADVPTTMAASALSLGDALGIVKSGNTCSFVTDAYTSAASNVCVIRGAIRLSPLSTIEVGFLSAGQVYGSTVSQVIP